MEKVYIHGSFMNENFGDFLLFEAVSAILSDYRESIEYYSTNVSDFYRNYAEYRTYPKVEAIKRADLAVFSGGGYYGEPNTNKKRWNRRMLKLHALPAIKLIFNKKPICIVGVGVGPLRYFISRKAVAFIFNRAEIVSVRDEESKQFLIQYGVKREIHVIPDWIMGCQKEMLLKPNHILQDVSKKGCLLVHLSSYTNDTDNPVNNVIDDLISISKKQGIRLLVITDSFWQTKNAISLKNRLADCGADLYLYHDPFELCSLINMSIGVITDKLHVGIVAAKLGKLSFSVARASKTPRFYKQIGREKYSVPLEDVKKGLVESWLSEGMNDTLKCETVISEAGKNAELLRGFLEKHL